MLSDHSHSVKLHLARTVASLFYLHGRGVAVGRDGGGVVTGGDLLPVSEQKSLFTEVKRMLQTSSVGQVSDDRERG